MSQAPATNVAGTALGSGFGTAARKPLPGPESAVADIFLSPRVVDKRTFEEYSTTLQALIREASGHGRTLETTSTEIKSLREGVQTVSRDLQTRLEAAVKVIPSLESRVSRAEQVAQDVTKLTADPEQLAEQIRQKLQGLVSAKADEVETLCRQAVERTITRLESRQNDITRASEEFEAFVAARLGDLQAAHDATLARIETREKAAADTLTSLHAELFERLSKSESAAMQSIEARERAALDAVVDHQRRVIDLQASIETKLDEARRTSESIADENRRALETQQREGATQIEEAERQMRVKLDELRELANEIERRG
jgi:chromosome segregation ATPase